jgi:hypothetical protein
LYQNPEAIMRPSSLERSRRIHSVSGARAWVIACLFGWPLLLGGGACNVSEAEVREGTPSGAGGAGGAVVDVARTGGAGGIDHMPPPLSLPDAGPTLPGVGGATGGDTAGPSSGKISVYAHSATDLFQIDPESLSVTRVGKFFVRTPSDTKAFISNMTDIAIDKDGKMTGVTFDAQLLTIDPNTVECLRLSKLNSTLNGLSWIRTDDGNEVLAATGLAGEVLRIDPMTGQATPIGNLGGGLRSSGDIVSVEKYGTLITLTGAIGGPDRLARVDPATGVATVIGSTKFQKIWGLGFWGNRVFGFTATGEFILIDPKTGEATLVTQDRSYAFWGAAVSTSAPVIVD